MKATDYLKKHKHGIFGTILFHMGLAILLLSIGISKQKEHINTQLYIDFEEIDILEDIREEKEAEIKELIRQTELSEAELDALNKGLESNRAVNEAEEQLNQKLSDDRNQETDDLYEMARKLKEQLAETDQAFQDRDEFGASDEEITDSIKAEPENIVYKGPTNITYNLKDRYVLKQKVPVYKCQGGGKVKVIIVVDQKGYVIKANVDAKTSVIDECFINAAVNAASVTRFNRSSKASKHQKGSITYNFVAQ